MSQAPDFAAQPIDQDLAELMAEAAYEAGRPSASSRPPWRDCSEFWRSASCNEQLASITAARRAGYRIDKP